MNTAEIIPIRNNAEASAIDSLLEERAGIVAELGRLAAIDGPVLAAEGAVGAVDRAITELDAAERDLSQSWATNGVGAPPEPRTAERRSLVARRAELQSDLESARNRANAVAPRRTALNGELRRIDHLIFAEKLRGAIEEARRLDARAHEIAVEMREPIGRVAALKFALMQHRSAVSGNAAAERLIGEAIDALSKFKMPEIGGDPAKLNDFIAQWRDALR